MPDTPAPSLDEAVSPVLDEESGLPVLLELPRGVARGTLELIRFAGGAGLLLLQVLRELPRSVRTLPLVLEQIRMIGVHSLFLVAVTAMATGSVMALQFGHGVEKFGGTLYVPRMVSLSILREMGPVFTSLLVSGRVGAGIASEVGSMKVTQQIDAIRALGTSPVQRIVIPRLLAAMVALPLLTLFADAIAMLGALLVSRSELGIPSSYFIAKAVDAATLSDLLAGLAKTVVFAAFIALAGCWKGLDTRGGTLGVGESTKWVVVACSVFIMVSDFFLTRIFVLTVYPP